jgi:hypothetical protein
MLHRVEGVTNAGAPGHDIIHTYWRMCTITDITMQASKISALHLFTTITFAQSMLLQNVCPTELSSLHSSTFANNKLPGTSHLVV